MHRSILRAWLARILELLGISSPDSVLSRDETTAAASEADVALPQETEPEIVPLDSEGRRMLEEIRRFASWWGPEGARRLAAVREAFALTYPGREEEIGAAIRDGEMLRGLCERAYKAAVTAGAKSAKVQEILDIAHRDHGWAVREIMNNTKRGEAAYQRRVASLANKGKPRNPVKPRTATAVVSTLGKTLLNVRRSELPVPEGLHGSDLRAQRPSPHWTVVIDESGSKFGADADSFKARLQGRFVAVAVPGQQPTLPALPKAWHAVDCTDDREIDQVFQTVLSAEAAVFGVAISSLPVTPGERWADGVALLIDWILRLLPVDGPTKVEVLVENRGSFQRGDQWPLIERDCLRRLALAFPQTAGWIDLSILVVGKQDCALGGYADAVAYTWARTSPESTRRMRESLLAGSCLLEADAHSLLHAWDAFTQGVRLPGPDWWNLLPQAAGPTDLASALLDRIGIECRADSALWSVYLAETRRQMAGGAVDLGRLGDATNWLERWIPGDAALPPLMRLAWLVVKLARSNHSGASEGAWERELGTLAPSLFDEAAPLVCHADLHLAVARTNRYDFKGAGVCLDRWKDLPVAVPGLKFWGQVRSSLGQHAAFEGDQVRAGAFFHEALAAFGRLSDPEARIKEIEQTNCYLAIALMDDLSVADGTVREAVVRVTGSLEKAMGSLPVEVSPGRRFAHHLLLRWLVHRKDQEAVAAYLATRSAWKEGEGHPWPLIELYRGILLRSTDAAEAVRLAMHGALLAFEPGQEAVVRLIGACCRVIAADWGEPWEEREVEIQALKEALPLAKAEIDALLAWKPGDGEPVDLLRRVLPFNFR